MPKYKVGDHIKVTGDTRTWVVTAVHNTDPPTYDLELLDNPGITQHNVPEGDMIIAT